MTIFAGVDIGGTKCAASLGIEKDGKIEIIEKIRFLTLETPEKTILKLINLIENLQGKHKVEKLDAIGVSCGGPLNSRTGTILSPPNLPGWDNVPIVGKLYSHFQVPVSVQNDANAGALAEWKWGAGRGTENMIFLTFGTGMGAGLILNGRLYSGTNDFAGEVGHLRLAEDGPVGFGKAGSFEGFCSGGGIAKLAQAEAAKALAAGNPPMYCRNENDLPHVTAKKVADAANSGDPLALEVYKKVSSRLGQGIALLIDILNPEKIIIGSIYSRQQSLLDEEMWKVLNAEVIPYSLEVCKIVPTGLGELIGDYASLSVAHEAWLAKEIKNEVEVD